MRTVGVVCEYNPFHWAMPAAGPLRQQDPEAAVVCLMSGLYVQRGQPGRYSPGRCGPGRPCLPGGPGAGAAR